MLVGPDGSGKSHLAAIWARKAARAPRFSGTGSAKRTSPASRERPALLIEDADRSAARGAAVPSRQRRPQSERWMLMTARARARRLGPQHARPAVAAAPGADRRLGAPDLELTEAVLFKLFSDRQLAVEPRVVAYIAPRIERSLDAARALVAALDGEALARGRRVTRAMAAEFLREAPPEDEAT